MTSAIHRLSVADALASLRSTAAGLTSDEALTRQREFGLNRLARARERPPVFQFFAQLTHFFALILWAAAALAMLAEYWNPGSGMATLAYAIVAVILVNGVFSYWQERRAHKAMAALARQIDAEIKQLIVDAHSRASAILRDRRSILETLTAAGAGSRRGRRPTGVDWAGPIVGSAGGVIDRD